MKTYDLRSDTITKPTAAMREYMMHAEVGDDVYHEDPTVNALQDMAAELTGKERALFVSSGSMGNLLSLYINCGRGNEVLCSSQAHILHHEVGSPGAIAGVMPVAIDAPNGILDAPLLEGKIREQVYDMAATTMVEVENTIGGNCYPVDNLKRIRSFANKHNIKVHMDGARIFNAAIAGHTSVKELASYADTITFCLSKGLGAPMGSMLCTDEVFYQKALKIRKMLGGGMRQMGIMAAAGIYALEHHVERLAEDHYHAQLIAEALSNTSWAVINPKEVETNIVFFSSEKESNEKILEALKNHGILGGVDGGKVRLVTNLGLNATEIKEICGIIATMKL